MVDDRLTANFRSYWLGFSRFDDPPASLTVYRSGAPIRNYNGVLRVAGDPVDVAAVRAQFGATPWVWWAGPDSPPSTGDWLLEAGAEAGPSFPIMVLDLTGIHLPAESPSRYDGLAIARARGAEGLAEWVAGFAPSFGVPPGNVEAVNNVWDARPDLGDGVTRFHARDGDRMVGTAALLTAHGVAGIYNVTTDPGYRRRGIASVLTTACLIHARGLGLRVVTLQSRAAGLAVYERLGFRTVGEYRAFTFS